MAPAFALLIATGGRAGATSINSVPFAPNCAASAGSISIDFDAGCLVNGQASVTAISGGDAVIPPGFQLVYLLSRTNGLIIESVNSTPTFTVTSLDVHRIHSLVYDPNTLDLVQYSGGDASVYDLYTLIWNGLCAGLNVSGAPFKVYVCEPTCTASAGTISSNNPDICLTEGSAELSATAVGGLEVPPGYSTLYVLTRGTGLVIQAVGTDPEFTVTSAGLFTIHTLVYDPTTLDLSTVVPGQTTGFDVNALLQQGGGTICASLDVAGAEFQVADCGPPPCPAEAGSLTETTTATCLENGSAIISAAPNGDAFIPFGFEILYLLGEGLEGTVLATNNTGTFTINGVATYTINLLVYNPATFDPGSIQIGVTTALSILQSTVDAGGTLCADLTAVVIEPITEACPCTANAGAITSNNPDICLTAGSAQLVATPAGGLDVPSGYSVLYVLTSGTDLVIQAVSTDPVFTVTSAGLFTIHTLVYDPTTLDLSAVVPGQTTGFDVNTLLQQGGGAICASLDVAGAEFQVADCGPPPCTVDAGSITPDQPLEICLENGPVVISATPNGDANLPPGFEVVYLLGEGIEGYIREVSTTPEFTVSGPAMWTIAAFAYNPSTYSLDDLDINGISGIISLRGSTVEEGGTLCASVGWGLPGTWVNDCTPICTANAGADAELALCSNGTAVDLFALLGPNAQQGGIWTGPTSEPVSGVFAPGNDSNGAYTYYVGDVEGCPGDSAQVFITVAQAPDAGTNGQVTACSTDATFNCLALLGGLPDANGIWSGPNGAPFSGEFDPVTDLPGVYTYTVNAPPPCAASTSTLVIVVQDCCTAGTDGDTTVCFTDAPFPLFSLLGGDPCIGGNWVAPNDNPHSNVFVPSADPSGVYTYIVTGSDGEPGSATVTVNVIECPGGQLQLDDRDAGSWQAQGMATGDAPTATAPALSAWPNPATDVLTVRGLARWNSAVRIDLLDGAGRRVLVPVTFTDGAALLDVRSLASGGYVLRITDGTHATMLQFMRGRD